MTLHLETWHVVLACLVVVADVLVGLRTWNRAARAERRLAMMRQLAHDHVGYVPDDLIGSAKGATFERASGYWSRMVLRELDHPDPNATLRVRR
jgi:hypothetical protein